MRQQFVNTATYAKSVDRTAIGNTVSSQHISDSTAAVFDHNTQKISPQTVSSQHIFDSTAAVFDHNTQKISPQTVGEQCAMSTVLALVVRRTLLLS